MITSLSVGPDRAPVPKDALLFCTDLLLWAHSLRKSGRITDGQVQYTWGGKVHTFSAAAFQNLGRGFGPISHILLI